ncbi:MAG: hypothetical protein H0W50_09210 [Parachlamydiaceae bacterium]|nr:hypothetical protein [Parachlamydiaceae bacterium]
MQATNNIIFPFQGQFLALEGNTPRLSDKLTEALKELQQKVPNLLTDTTIIPDVERKFNAVRLINYDSYDQDRLLRITRITLYIPLAVAIAGIALYVFGASLITAGAIGVTSSATSYFISEPKGLQDKLDQTALKLAKKFWRRWIFSTNILKYIISCLQKKQKNLTRLPPFT